MKVVVISYDFYSEYTANKLYLKDELEKNGYAFEFWSAAGIRIKNESLLSSQKATVEMNLVLFDDLESLCKSIKEQGQATATIFILNLLTQNTKTLKIFRQAVRYGFWCFQFDLQIGFYRSIIDNTPQASKQLLPYLLNPYLFLKKIQNRVSSHFLSKQFSATNFTVFGTGKMWGNKETSFSYGDLYDVISQANEAPLFNDSYIVFCDIFLPFHPDFAMAGIKQIDAKRYFNNLNSFFLKLEKKFAMPVVIATHPRSNYTDEFDGRKVFKGKTHLLVRDATLALFHYSSSIFYACIYNIPSVQIFDSQFTVPDTAASKVMKDMKSAHELLKLKLFNIEEEDLLEFPTVNTERYNHFLQTYLLAQDYPMTNFEIFNRFLKSKNII